MRHTHMSLAAAFLMLPMLAHGQELARPNLLLKEVVQGMPKGDKQEVRVLTATIQPGGKTPFHTHRFPVTVYVLEGTFTLDGEPCVESLTIYDSFFTDGLTPPAPEDVPWRAASPTARSPRSSAARG